MRTSSNRLWLYLVAFITALASPLALAQEKYPTRPIEFIVPWGPGGGSDQTARKISKLLEAELGVSVPVVNVPGATGNTGMTKLLSAPADGYSIAILAAESYALLAGQPQRWSTNDFIFLATMITLPTGFYVAGDRYADWKAFEKEARSRAVKVSITGFGGLDDITVNYLVSKGLKLVAVPFANPGERYAAVLGGHVDALSSPAGNIKSMVESRQLRPIIFFGSERLPEYKDVPVSTELGYDVTLPQRRVVIIKTGTDPARVAILAKALARVAQTEEYKAFLRDAVASPTSYADTAGATAAMQQDLAQMRAVIQATKK